MIKRQFHLRKSPFYPLNYEDSLFPTSYINSITKYPKVLPRVLLRPLQFINVRSRILADTKQPPIRLTDLAIKQDGYDWAFLAYTVCFGGSMIWFGSSSGWPFRVCIAREDSVGNCASRLARPNFVRNWVLGDVCCVEMESGYTLRSPCRIRHNTSGVLHEELHFTKKSTGSATARRHWSQ